MNNVKNKSDSLFQGVIEQFIQGKMVCSISPDTKRMFDYINEDGSVEERVTNYLSQIGRSIEKTESGTGYYCVVSDLEQPGVRGEVFKQFSENHVKFEGLVRWSGWVKNVSRASPYPISAGQKIKKTALLDTVTGSPNLWEEFKLITKRLARKDAVDGKEEIAVDWVLSELVKTGYLYRSASSSISYIATSKWDLLYEQLRHLSKAEGIVIAKREEEAAEEGQFFKQRELL